MLLVFGLSGFASLALEVIWFRILVLFLPATTYAFTTMLATVLLGLAGGGWIAARLLRRDRDWMAWLTTIQIATGLLIVVSLVLLSVTLRAGLGHRRHPPGERRRHPARDAVDGRVVPDRPAHRGGCRQSRFA